YSFRSGSDDYSGHPDPDPFDLHRGAPKGHALDVAHCTATASATTASTRTPPPPPPPAPVKGIVKAVARLIQSGKLMQPRAIPKEVAVFKEAELPPDVINNSNQGGVFGGSPGQGLIGNTGPALPPPPKAAAPARIKQGGQVTAASIITQTRPVYPALARQARIQGNVVLHAIIDKEGKVAQLEVISGHPLLVQSALDAGKQRGGQSTPRSERPGA